MNKGIRLGVNIDHVATLRQARGTDYPDPVEAALLAIEAGADLITLHLREDRRHIQDDDLTAMKQLISVPINLEMAVTDEMAAIACELKPKYVCLVPEKREELTTEGGLDVLCHQQRVREVCAQLAEQGIIVSLFIDPDPQQIQAAMDVGAPVIELHTGNFADAQTPTEERQLLQQLEESVSFAQGLGLRVNAGHGLRYENVSEIAAIDGIDELNIGHAIVARAVMIGFYDAVSSMKQLMLDARL